MAWNQSVYRHIFDNINTSLFLADAETGVIVDTNQQGTVLLGRKRKEIIGMHQSQLHPPDKTVHYRELFSSHVRQARAVELEAEIVRKSGEVIPVTINASTVNLNGRRLILGLFNDISEQKQIANELRESEERFCRLSDASFEGIGIFDKGVILDANRAFAEIFNYELSDIIGADAMQFVAPESREKVWKNIQSGYEKPYEAVCIRKDGTRFFAEMSGKVTHYHGREVRVSAIRDITERKRLRANMQYYISEIIKGQEEERKRIARELHDDTVQSLVSLAFDIDSICNNGTQLPSETVSQLRQLREKVYDVMKDVRRFSHDLRPDVLDRLGLAPALELLADELKEQGFISARMDVVGIEKRLPLEAELVLFRIAQEATRNIIKHSQATEAVIGIEYNEDSVKLAVTDNGKGFVLPERLCDLAGEGKLGLIGMQERVRLIDGDFSLYSKPNQGTKITVEIKI